MMMAFDHVFGEVARRDSRALRTVDDRGAPATFVFQEYYCTDPGCDCRRVLLHLHWVEHQRVAASINYAFEPSKRRGEPQISLDPLNPQSEHSESLLALFTEVIATEKRLRDDFVRHYTMWKQVVDDPAHPEHAKMRGAAFERARAQARTRARAPRRRGPDRSRSGETDLERVVAKAAGADSKLQQRFKRLLAKVERLRQRLRAWKEHRPEIDRELAMYRAAIEERCRLARELVLLLDRAHASAGLSKADRKRLAAVIATFAGDLLELDGEGDAELKAIYNRHTGGDFDVEAAADEAAGVEAMKSLMAMFGVDVKADTGTFEELRTAVEAQMEVDEAEAAAAQERRATRKRSAKQLASEARRAEEQRGANKAVQEVYRALAMALHPDREQDADERIRKAELMREVNVAYEGNDLLRLLEIQLQLERVDPSRVEVLAEERVRHFNRILDEQSRQLAAELEGLEMPFRFDLGLSPRASLEPSKVLAIVQADVADARQDNAFLARDLKAFEDMRELKVWLKEQVQARPRGRAGRGGRRDAELFD
jgi:hypothetical protein